MRRRHYEHILSCVIHVNKALYGCVQPGKLRYDRSTQKLRRDIGFEVNPIETCAFNKIVNSYQNVMIQDVTIYRIL
jgi:hypothetical protein